MHHLKWPRAQRPTEKEVRLENTLPKVVEGSKAHSKGGRARKHITHEVRARRRTQKEVRLESALPKIVEDSKARLKRGKVRKCTTYSGQGLKDTLERRQG